MKIKDGIKSAIEGGWIPQGMENSPQIRKPNEIMANFYHQPTFLLNTSFWKAIGKTEGWENDLYYRSNVDMEIYCNESEFRQLQCIKNIQTGKDILSAFDLATN